MDDEHVGRRLAVILAADVVGYSRLISVDETGTFIKWKTVQADLIEPKVNQFRGRIFKTTGDGFLAEFSSAVNAAQCAIDLQLALSEFNDDTPDDQALRMRIGINLGDVIIEEGDIFGNGVNIAARLESIAEPGTICVSANIHELIQNKMALTVEDRGKTELKNIPGPVHVYQICVTSASSGSPETVKSKSSPPAVAVLPFSNMSGDPEQEYFSDGLTEDIITALSQWRSIPVIARNSTFTYKGKAVRVQTIAEELGVRYVLEGSVRKSGDRLRITAQLIDAETGHHVWAQKFDSQLEDVFDLQDQITNQIAATIVPELEQFENRRVSSKRTEDLTAWDYYLRGLETFYDETCEGTAASQKMFHAAVKADPSFSDAWARLGWTFAKQVMHGCASDPGRTIQQGFEASRKAVSLDNASALAHISLGTVHIWGNEMDLGLAEAQRAVELNPNFAHAAMAYGNRLDLCGRTEEGIAQMTKALLLNPRDPICWRYMAYLSRAYLSIKDYEKAADWGQKAALLRPDLPEALFRYALCLAHLDRVSEVRELISRCTEMDPDYVSRMCGWRPYEDDERNKHILSGLRRHGLLP